jgi:hypothetical protein
MLIVTMLALERAGVEFIDENYGRLGVRDMTAKGAFIGR